MADLTPREREIADLVVEGLSNTQIADRLHVPSRAVTVAIGRLYRRAGVLFRSEFVEQARQQIAATAAGEGKLVNQPAGSGTEPDEITDETIYQHLKEYQEAGMIEYVLPTEPLGEQWIIGHNGQILKFLTKEGIVGFLAGTSVCATYVGRLKGASTGPIWDHPAWGAAPRQAVATAAAHFTDVWAELMTALPDQYACEMNCAEANAAADLYRALGDDDTAALVLEAHGRYDTEDDEHYHGPRTPPATKSSPDGPEASDG